MNSRLCRFVFIFLCVIQESSGLFVLNELNFKLKSLVPEGYEINGYYDLQNQMFENYPNVYHYRECKKCGYKVVDYGKPYKIVFKPDLNYVVSNSTVFMVFTQPKETYLRQVFRNMTQELRDHYDISYFFVMTRDRTIENGMGLLREEQRQHHDMLVFNHANSYNNLVLNVLLSFHYVHNMDLPCRYFVKVDADIAVNIHALMNILYNTPHTKKKVLYLGKCSSGEYIKKKGNKQYVPENIYRSEKTTPPYAKGGLYVLSKQTLPYLLIGARHLPFITHQEDVTCGRALHLMSVPCQRHSNTHWLARNGCNQKVCDKLIAIHSLEGGEDVRNNYGFFNETRPFFQYIPQRRVIVNETSPTGIDYTPRSRPVLTVVDVSSYRNLYY